MLKRWNNKHGVRFAIITRTSDLPLRGLVIQPSGLPHEVMGKVMKSGRQSMVNRHGEASVEQAINDAISHINHVNQPKVRI